MSRYDEIRQELLKKHPALNIIENEPMSRHTSFRIGGPARLMVSPASREELQGVLSVLYDMEERPFLLGSGTNLLVSDAGFEGVVISTRSGFRALERIGDTVLRAEAGVSMTKLSAFAADCGLTGLEFAHGIPGSVGGGIFMNAGAYGGEMAQVAVSTVYMTYDGCLHIAEGEEQEFGYRKSLFQQRQAIVLETTLSLQHGDPEEIRGKIRELDAKRREKQPLELPSAGSAFRRPVGYFAGALIEQAGLKGYRVGDAAVSEKHAGFIVNLGNATAAQVHAVIDDVVKKVEELSGVVLEPEIRFL